MKVEAASAVESRNKGGRLPRQKQTSVSVFPFSRKRESCDKTHIRRITKDGSDDVALWPCKVVFSGCLLVFCASSKGPEIRGAEMHRYAVSRGKQGGGSVLGGVDGGTGDVGFWVKMTCGWYCVRVP